MVKKYRLAFTMIELLVVVSIISIFIVTGIYALRGQIAKGRDSRRKADLNKIQNALEDYYNDKNCYPSELICGTSLSPWLSTVPCDPINNTQTNYFYSYQDTGSCKKWYKIYAKLENINDPIIPKVGCAPPLGCGPSGYYNYWISSPNMNLAAHQPGELWWPDIGGETQGTGQATPTSISASSPTPTSQVQITSTPGPTNPLTTPTPTPTLSADGCSSGCRWATAFFGGVCGQDCDLNTETCVFRNFLPKCCYNESCVMP